MFHRRIFKLLFVITHINDMILNCYKSQSKFKVHQFYPALRIFGQLVFKVLFTK